MPNYSTNLISVKGTEKEVLAFLNDGVKAKVTLSNVNDYRFWENNFVTLRSWLPMPKTFVKYDTTNERLDLFFWLLNLVENGVIKSSAKGDYTAASAYVKENLDKLTKKYGKEYDLYSKRWNRAKRYHLYSKRWNRAKRYQKDKYGVVGWYDYNVKTLGTKWDSKITNVEVKFMGDDEMIVFLSCETAWNTPNCWVNTMQEKYSNLKFACFSWEESGSFCGYYVGGNKDWIENRPLEENMDYEELIADMDTYFMEFVEERL